MKQVKLVPALRFKEFDLPWNKNNISDVLTIGSGKDYKHLNEGEIPVYGSGGIMRYVDKYLHDGESVCIGRKGTIDKPRFLSGKFWTVDTLFYTKDFKSVLPYFVYNQFLKINWYKYNEASGVPSLSKSTIYSIPFNLPSLPEQQKIADFLTSVDGKIQALTRKVDLLKDYKKGVMQKIFKQEIRFKKDDDGGEFGDWEELRANKLFKNHSNKDHDGSLVILAVTQDEGVVRRDSIGKDIISSVASVKSYKIVEEGDFVISLRSFQGGIEYSNVYGICSPAYTILKPIKEINDQFYKYYLKKEDFIKRLSATVVGIRDGKQISYSAFSGMKLLYPSVKEQTKVANFLSSIDRKIESAEDQLSKMKEWKKGLLQKMFV